MMISIIPITTSATTPTSGACGDNLTWTYDSSTYTLIISGKGDMYDYKFNNRPWESYKNNIMQVVISDEVTSIGMYAFYYLTKTTVITIPDSVTSIKKSAFANCYKLESVTIPDSVTIIGEQAFYACESLTSVVIPKSVTTIEKNAFYLCDNLTSITVDNNSQHFSSDEYGVLFNKDKTTLIKYPSSNCEIRYAIPDSVTEICQYAFDDCFNLKSVTVPTGVITLAKYSFHYQNYNLILYYNGTEKQWNSLINNNSITNYITRYTVHCLDKTLYPSGVCGNNLIWIYDNSIGTLTISGAGEMYNYDFDKNSGFGFRPWEDFIYAIEHIIIEDGVTSIGFCAFMDCQNLIDVNLSDSITSIGEETFYFYPNLTDVYYTGTEEQWKAISIGGSNDPLLKATIHYNYHIHKHNAVITEPSCTENGYTTYTCECGNTYIDDYIDALGHSHTSEITTPATHTATGVMTYTCTCGDTYTETIEKLPKHTYETVATPPTCTEQGYTTYTCVCGDSYVDDYVDATGHSYTSEMTAPATHTTTGVMTYTCSCGDTYTETIDKLAEHNYETVITAPTCTDNGYTTFTCECGESYVGDYTDALGHTEETIPAVAPNCTETGLTEGTKCSVCDETLTEQKELPANGHTPANAVE